MHVFDSAMEAELNTVQISFLVKKDCTSMFTIVVVLILNGGEAEPVAQRAKTIFTHRGGRLEDA